MNHYQANNPKRQKLTPFEQEDQTSMKSDKGIAPSEHIISVERLKELLQCAIRIEHATIPPYLSALYSIKEGCNLQASAVIRSVVVEEMLHMILAANILNAIGGTPEMNTRQFMMSYPGPLPESDGKYDVRLLKFSKEAIRIFLKIEKPADSTMPQAYKYTSIGQFYLALRNGLIYCDQHCGGIFKNEHPERQVGPEHYYGSGGNIIKVHNLSDALLAIDEIVGQGEGVDGSINDPDDDLFSDDIEYAHYFRFNEIFQERFYQKGDTPQSGPSGKKLPVDWTAVRNMKPDITMSDYTKDSDLWHMAKDFNKQYKALLNNINAACNGQPQLLTKGIALMYDLKYRAIELMKIPLGYGELTAGPTFEYEED